MKLIAPDLHRTLKLWPRSIGELRALVSLLESDAGQTADEAAATGGHSIVRWTVWAAGWQRDGLATCHLDPRTTQGRPKRRYHANPTAATRFEMEFEVTF